MSRLVLGLWWLIADGAIAQEVRVAVFAAPDEVMAERLATELRSVGLVPERVDRDDAADVEAARVAAGAVAAFEVTAGRVAVLVADDDGSPATSALTWTPGDAASEALVGVQAVELLRAGLLETRDLGRRGARLSLVDLALATARAGQGTALSIGALGTAGSFTHGPNVALDLGIRVPATDRLVVTGEGSTPFVRSAYRGDAGEVFLAVSRVGAGARWRLGDVDAAWVPDAGIAVGLSVLGFDFEAAPQFLGRDERSFVRGYAGLRAGLSTPRAGPIGGRFDLRVDGSAPVEVALDGVASGRWASVNLGAATALDVVF